MNLLDSNIWIYLLARELPEHEPVMRWFRDELGDDVLLPSLVELEVTHYAARQMTPERARSAIDALHHHPRAATPLTPSVTARAGELLLTNPERGIGGRDAAILLHAREKDATLVTHDTRLFELAIDLGIDAHDPVA